MRAWGKKTSAPRKLAPVKCRLNLDPEPSSDLTCEVQVHKGLDASSLRDSIVSDQRYDDAQKVIGSSYYLSLSAFKSSRVRPTWTRLFIKLSKRWPKRRTLTRVACRSDLSRSEPERVKVLKRQIQTLDGGLGGILAAPPTPGPKWAPDEVVATLKIFAWRMEACMFQCLS